jgi:HEAT repeat protein
MADAVTYGDLSLRLTVIEAIGEACLAGTRVPSAVDPLIRALGNRFLRKKAEVALRRMGDRRGLLAVKRRKIRDLIIPKPARPAEVGRILAGETSRRGGS